MSIVIKVRRKGEAVKHEHVTVSWVSGGTSSGKTDDRGNFNTGYGGPATARYVRIKGQDVATNEKLEEGDNTFNLS